MRIGLALFTLAVLALRRPDQLTHPYIWCEDGAEILPAYLARGLASVFEPVSGYLILPAKVIDVAAFELSFSYYPEIAYALTAAFTVFVVLAIATAPTVLRWRYACAVAVLLVPSGAEVFGVALYAFWWATLLLILALLWAPDAAQGSRAAFVLIGGFATPLVIPLALLFVVRFVIERRAAFVTVLVCVAAAVQAYFVLTQGGEVSAGGFEVVAVLRKFFGNYLSYRWWRSQPALRDAVELSAGVLVLSVLVYAFVRALRKRDGFLVLLLAVFGAALLASVLRVNAAGALDPSTGGPRYFFYPWLLTSWISLWLAHDADDVKRAAFFVGLVVLATVNGAKIMRWRHDSIDWRAEIARCAAAPETYGLPIHFEGAKDRMWSVELLADECRRALR